MEFAHISEGKARMVDISEKVEVPRIAVAEGIIKLKKKTIEAIMRNEVVKGNVLAAANIAGVIAVKKTSELIPMCHQIPINSAEFKFEIEENSIRVFCTVKSKSKTGVEMEALTGVSIALLTIWDMVKSLEKDESGNYPETSIEKIVLLKKIKG
ncbi:MAG: cyclic pyranopterin monophosphate synthase MoaC [Archaeoglobaceae archaeon]|nr:cyclic pyranopterin monophosphate synthase MoaC [Archaeoglobaceae archaeon]MDW7989710.1 cyclic pyranopterin monophosphate synthase MoaC [Archaeoglobaceae archaeon]